MRTYKLIRKEFTVDELTQSFTIGQGRIIGVVEAYINEDLTRTVIFVVEEN